MTRTACVASIVLPAMFAIAGCGTLTNMERADHTKPDAPKPGRVYGGVERDVAWSQQCFDKSSAKDGKSNGFVEDVKGTYYLAVDLPFSFVGDTLTLPITLLVALGEEEDSLQMNGHRSGSQGGESIFGNQ